MLRFAMDLALFGLVSMHYPKTSSVFDRERFSGFYERSQVAADYTRWMSEPQRVQKCTPHSPESCPGPAALASIKGKQGVTRHPYKVMQHQPLIVDI